MFKRDQFSPAAIGHGFRIFHKIPENYLKTAIIIGLFLATFFVFKMLQRPQVYNSTLKKITHTYVRDSVDENLVWDVQQPYYYRDSLNTVRWDGLIYWDISQDLYKTSDWEYAFFPLFPLLWRFLHISGLFIGLFNYLLFGIAVLLLSDCFFDRKKGSLSERICVFTTALILPTITVYYLPYAEALFTFTFALGLWGLIKNKYWIFFIAVFFFAMTRPIFVHLGLAFLIIDGLYFTIHRDISKFLKEITLKLLPLVSGTLLVFIFFYFESGSFFKYFEAVNKHWNISFSIPDQISDWSVESFGINVFSLFFIIIPSLIIFLKHFINLYRSKEKPDYPGIFSNDLPFIREYFFHISIVYFVGILFYTLFYQNGSLNGLNRYMLASPFFYIFFFYGYQYVREVSPKIFLSGSAILLIAGISMLTGFEKIEPKINFNDFGFFILVVDLVFLYSLKYLNNMFRAVSMILITSVSIILITYLYNIYLCDGWIFT